MQRLAAREERNLQALDTALENTEYIIQKIETSDEEMENFLFTLGCYAGEPITVVAKQGKNLVVSIKNSRYSIDDMLAKVIFV